MRTACTVWTLVIALSLATNAGAAAKKKDKDATCGTPYFRTIDNYLKPVTLTDDQKSKLDGLKKEYEPKFKDAYAKQNVLTPEQTKAGEEAKKAAKAEGKKGKELKAAFEDAVKETDDQKAQAKAAKKQLSALEKEMHGKVLDLLTAEQKAQIKAKPKKGNKAAKAAPTT